MKAERQGWELVSLDYCADEVRRNLAKLGPAALRVWERLTLRERLVRADVTLAGLWFSLDPGAGQWSSPP